MAFWGGGWLNVFVFSLGHTQLGLDSRESSVCLPSMNTTSHYHLVWGFAQHIFCDWCFEGWPLLLVLPLCLDFFEIQGEPGLVALDCSLVSEYRKARAHVPRACGGWVVFQAVARDYQAWIGEIPLFTH